MRKSMINTRNPNLGDWTRWGKRKDNLKFFAEALRVMNDEYHLGNGGMLTIGMIGSRDIPGVTLRRAQAVTRWDRRPSLWSHCFLIAGSRDETGNIGRLPIMEIPLFSRGKEFPLPELNGLNRATLADYRDLELHANVALLAVCRRHGSDLAALNDSDLESVRSRANEPNHDRLRYDLWESLSAWQRYMWQEAEGPNPARNGIPIPCSAYVEMVFEAIGLDLVPSASERNSSPEHLWNAAVWWYPGGERPARAPDTRFALTGCYVLRDKGCAQLSHDE